MTACCLFVVLYILIRSYANKIQSHYICYVSKGIYYFTDTFAIYLPITLIFFLNFRILFVARKQRKRILPGITLTSVDHPHEESANRISFVLEFMAALKAAKTFAIIVAVLTFCVLIPSFIGDMLYIFCTVPCRQIWFALFNFELCGINSVVNAFIYGMRHVRYRKAYLHIFLKLFSCHKMTNFKFS